MLVLELPPPPEPPLEVEEGVEGVPVPIASVRWLVPDGFMEVVLERETIGGAVGVASGSRPAACARVISNPLSYTDFQAHERSAGQVHLRCNSQMPSAGLKHCKEWERDIWM